MNGNGIYVKLLLLYYVFCWGGGGGITFHVTYQARQTRPNSGGGVAEGQPRFDKGGGCNNFLLFTR